MVFEIEIPKIFTFGGKDVEQNRLHWVQEHPLVQFREIKQRRDREAIRIVNERAKRIEPQNEEQDKE